MNNQRVTALPPIHIKARDTARDGVRTFVRLTPSRQFLLSFLLLITVCTLGLLLLPGLYTGERLGFVDALFTATSAVCVTGLIVVDTATFFTIWGQLWLLIFIQFGGLGLLTFATIILSSLGRRVSLRTHSVFSHSLPIGPRIDVPKLVRDIVLFTFSLEAIGALILYWLWAPSPPSGNLPWHAVFQSISAFCNAGFSTFSDSLAGFQQAPATLLLVMGLIVTGGIGFLTVEELFMWWRRRSRGTRTRLSIHTRIVLVSTAILVVGGSLVMIALELNGVLRGLSWVDRIVNGLFMSITPRTAGFNTIDHSVASDGTNFFTTLLMFIGGSPGSTTGGVKTTTFALIVLLAVSRLRGHEAVNLSGRSIPPETVQRSVGLVALAAVAVTAAILLLAVTEATGPDRQGRFLAITFEAFSAFNTVGLSMGATDELTTAGKWIIIFMMYVGRVGPLTAAAALSRSRLIRSRAFRYSYEDVEIG